MDPYDLGQNPADAVYEALDVRLTKAGSADYGFYQLNATVSFLSRSITTSVDVSLNNGWSASGAATQSFAGQDVRANVAIDLPNQQIFAGGSGLVVPGVTLSELINTNTQPDQSNLQHNLEVQQGAEIYTGGTTTTAGQSIF